MKEQITQSMFDYLLKLSNGKLVLTPEQLEKVIGISAKQQSALRKESKFPIKFKNIGKLVFYSISDVIDFMLSGQTQTLDAVKEVVILKKSSKLVTNASNIFMMKSFASVLNEEAQQLIELSNNLNKYADTFSLYEIINSKLSLKNTTLNIKEKVKKQ